MSIPVVVGHIIRIKQKAKSVPRTRLLCEGASLWVPGGAREPPQHAHRFLNGDANPCSPSFRGWRRSKRSHNRLHVASRAQIRSPRARQAWSASGHHRCRPCAVFVWLRGFLGM